MDLGFRLTDFGYGYGLWILFNGLWILINGLWIWTLDFDLNLFLCCLYFCSLPPFCIFAYFLETRNCLDLVIL